MMQNFQFLFAVYIPSQPISDRTPFWGVVAYSVGCVLTLILMIALIRKTRRDKLRRKDDERIR